MFIGFKQVVTRNQVIIKHKLNNIQERIDIIQKMQETILDKLNNQSYESLDDTLTECVIRIANNKHLEIMESKLLNENITENWWYLNFEFYILIIKSK